jgi:hypothetical protein
MEKVMARNSLIESAITQVVSLEYRKGSYTLNTPNPI